MKTSSRCVYAIAALLLSITMPGNAARPANYLNGFTQTRAIIETSDNRCLVLNIYLADTAEQHQRGLMFIDQMDEFEGMLFRYGREVMINMWMKNTHIPLDMVFIDDSARVVGVVHDAVPFTLGHRQVTGVSRYVLELNAGTARKFGIGRGSKVRFVRLPPAFMPRRGQ